MFYKDKVINVDKHKLHIDMYDIELFDVFLFAHHSYIFG